MILSAFCLKKGVFRRQKRNMNTIFSSLVDRIEFVRYESKVLFA